MLLFTAETNTPTQGTSTPIQSFLVLLSKLSFASMQDGSFGYDRMGGTTSLKVTNAKDAFTEELCRRLDNVNSRE